MEASSSIAVRVSGLERAVNRLETLEPAVVKQQVQDIREDVHEIREEMRALKRALYGLALSIAGGAVLFAFTAFQIWGSTP